MSQQQPPETPTPEPVHPTQPGQPTPAPQETPPVQPDVDGPAPGTSPTPTPTNPIGFGVAPPAD